MKPFPSRAVIDWLNDRETASLFLTAVTIGEIAYGIWILPSGKRRRGLQERFERFVKEAFENRILVFDELAARLYGEVMAERRRAGRPLGMADGQIVSIALSKGFAIATRNTQDFANCGVEIINPFSHVSLL